jgi:hypothetical protein
MPTTVEITAFIAAFVVVAPAAALDLLVKEPDPEPEPALDERVGVPMDTVLFELEDESLVVINNYSRL